MRQVGQVGKYTCVLLLVASVALVSAQSPPAFEVASIKPNTRRRRTSTSTFFQRSSQLSIINHPLRLLMAIAFSLDVNKARSLIAGLPGWADNGGWDIQAAAAGAASTQQKRLMLQALLADRFKLTYHRETRQLPVFALVAAECRAHGAAASPPHRRGSMPAERRIAPQHRQPRRAACELRSGALACSTCRAGASPAGSCRTIATQAWAGGRRVTCR